MWSNFIISMGLESVQENIQKTMPIRAHEGMYIRTHMTMTKYISIFWINQKMMCLLLWRATVTQYTGDRKGWILTCWPTIQKQQPMSYHGRRPSLHLLTYNNVTWADLQVNNGRNLISTTTWTTALIRCYFSLSADVQTDDPDDAVLVFAACNCFCLVMYASPNFPSAYIRMVTRLSQCPVLILTEWPQKLNSIHRIWISHAC